MSVILQPQKSFPIVRQIANHTDSNTYYVQAIIRDADGTVLSTVNLADQTGQRFQTAWHVVADTSGQGRYISIVTSVYTDTGYTTKSANYGDEENTYLVFDRVMPAMRGGGGGGIDSGTVRRIIKEELKNVEKEPIEFPTIPKPKEYEMRWDEILLAMDVLRRRIEALPTKATDLSPIASQLTELKQAVADKEVTPKTDLEPVLSRLEEDRKDNELSLEDIKSVVGVMEEKLTNAIPKEIKEAIANTKFVSQFNTFASPNPQVDQREDKKQMFDMSKLSS